jgi:PAS domain S-box-containing protein/diguanylate cyclase (GGDEF)-like protein
LNHAAPLKEIRLLFVEDELVTAEALQYHLDGSCAEVLHAIDAKQALSLFKSEVPDIVMTDIGLPGMNGLELCKKIRALCEDVPIIVLSSHGEQHYLLDAIEIGVNAFLTKPVKPQALKKKLRSLADKILLRKELTMTQKMAEEYLKVLESGVIFSKTNPKGIITHVNKAFEQISGYSKEELVGSPHNIVRHPDMPAKVYEELWETIRNGQIWKGVIKNRRKDGSSYTVESTIVPIFDPHGKITEYLALRYDISDKDEYTLRTQDVADTNLRIAQERTRVLLDQMYIDNNTGLPNTLALQRDLESMPGGTLLLLDVNNFNIYNKLHGFAFGDRMLAGIAHNLKSMLGGEGNLYKLGADRYAVLTDISDETQIRVLCDEIFAFFDNADIIVDTIENQITFSIGVAGIRDSRDVIIDAEYALDHSRKYGKRMMIIFHRDAEEFQEERNSIDLLNRTREYIYQDCIQPWYQPIIDVRTRKIFKYESLARIVDENSILLPMQFLHAAERLGLLTSVTKSMINKTFTQFSGSDTRFSINITERDILDGYLLDFVRNKADRFNVDPKNVTFEILENLTLSSDGDKVTSTLALVKDYGYNIAIDDFGSENSNFGRILSLRSDYLKIDGMFIKDCDTNPEKRQIIDAIVQLAKKLEIKTIAEYVSSESIFNVIEGLGVDYAQGYYFGKPAPIPQLPESIGN